jgi:hypothetical protein
MRRQHEDGYDHADEAEARDEHYAVSPESVEDRDTDWVMADER